MTTGRALPIVDGYPARAWLWALALGLVSALGFAPLGLWPLALLAAGLFAMLAARAPSWKRALWLGWLFGWAHFTFGNNWIATAFTHQAAMPAVLGWAAVPLLAVYLAVYPAMAAGAARALARTPMNGRGAGWPAALLFAGCWIVTEWLRSWVFTGYSWNPFGMVLLGPFDRPGLAALSPYMGTYALSGLAMLLGSALVLLARERRWRVAALVAVLITAGMYLPSAATRSGSVVATVVQPNLTQIEIGGAQYYESNFRRLAALSPRMGDGTEPRLLLWPESGLADYLRDGYPQRFYNGSTAMGSPAFARARLGQTAGPDTMLLTGAVDLEIGADGTAEGARVAVSAVSEQGELAGSYYKAHLVPYGEYLPMRGILEPLGLSRLVIGAVDFWPGPGPRTLDLGRFGQVGVQLCYEIIFSGQVVDPAARPDFIFNPSNDGWFGAFGPPQHLAQARMRAIEEGLPVIRSTVTGISAVVDARGVVTDHLPIGVDGRLDVRVPRALPATPFALLGNALAFGWAMVFLALGIVATRRRPA